MQQNLRMLDQVQVAKPCPANWDEMKGNDQVRHCTHCRLNVYNLSEMSGEDAERLVRTTEGRLCVRFYRRDDGTMITRDCPKGVRAARQKLAKVFFLTASCILSAIGCGAAGEKLKADFGFGTATTGNAAVPTTGKVAVSVPTTPAPVPTMANRTMELGEIAVSPKK